MLNFFIMLIFFFISMLMIFMNLLISKKTKYNREKMSLFECGFDAMSSTRIPFSIQFFLISLMFLIFDIEISLLIPFIYLFKIFNLIILISMFIFLMILIISLYLEFLENMLEWKLI